jgi:hypothetical protein
MMTREQYITSKTYDPIRVVYHYYSEKGGHYGYQELATALVMSGRMNQVMEKVMQEYDAKYELVALLDKEGKFIKYV